MEKMGAIRIFLNLLSSFPTLMEKLDSASQNPVIQLGSILLDLFEYDIPFFIYILFLVYTSFSFLFIPTIENMRNLLSH